MLKLYAELNKIGDLKTLITLRILWQDNYKYDVVSVRFVYHSDGLIFKFID